MLADKDRIFVTFTREENYLYTQGTGQVGFEVFPFSEKDFFARIAPIHLTFITDAQGIATSVIIHQAGRDIEAQRIAEIPANAIKVRCNQINAIVAADFSKHPIGSVTTGVVFHGNLVCTKSYGDADLDKHLPANQDTIYRLGSITKMFTAVMLEQLVDAGKVHFSDPVEKYFPAINTVQGRQNWAPPITLFELATHTSGLGREPDNTDVYVKGAVVDWEKTLTAALPHTHIIAEPSTRYFYSNIGYATLGAALSHAAGEPYLEYVPKHILQPLGMSHSSLVLTPSMEPNLS